MKKMMQVALAAALAAVSPSERAVAADKMAVDVVHFWVSKSEAAALDVFRKAWLAGGNQWADVPAENKVAVQRIVSDRIANGYAPSVMQWNANEGSRELPEMGIVQDINDVATADHWRDFIPATVFDRISYQGKVYFAPTNIHAENWLWTCLLYTSRAVDRSDAGDGRQVGDDVDPDQEIVRTAEGKGHIRADFCLEIGECHIGRDGLSGADHAGYFLHRCIEAGCREEHHGDLYDGKDHQGQRKYQQREFDRSRSFAIGRQMAQEPQ